MNSPYRVMIVDDETNVLSALRRLINAAPWMYQGISYRPLVECFASPVDALSRAKTCAFDLFIADYRMPEMDGVAFLSAVRAVQPDAARMVLSGYADLNGLIGAINEAQIYRFLSKPWNDYELVSAIAQALAYRDLVRENERLADEMRLQRGAISRQELEMKRLEAEEPGITHVRWGPDGSVLLD